jgi:hypothetical protein
MNLGRAATPLSGYRIRTILKIDQTAGARLRSLPQILIGGGTMPEQSRPPDKQQLLELIPDHPYESRREFVEKLAYKLWDQRGRPLGSPDADWFAAEQAVYASLVAAGTIIPSPNDRRNIGEEIYRPPQNS